MRSRAAARARREQRTASRASSLSTQVSREAGAQLLAAGDGRANAVIGQRRDDRGAEVALFVGEPEAQGVGASGARRSRSAIDWTTSPSAVWVAITNSPSLQGADGVAMRLGAEAEIDAD